MKKVLVKTLFFTYPWLGQYKNHCLFLRTDNFPKPLNRLEMIGDLKATLLLNRLLDPKSDLFKLVVISKVEEVMTQLLIETRSDDSLTLMNFLLLQVEVVFIVNME